MHVHCSYHKCLTVYFRRVMHRALGGESFQDFGEDLERFMAESPQLEFASVANHALPLEDLPADVTVSRFIRDPRDLIVSGYFYHRGGSERWTRAASPDPAIWSRNNRCIPDALQPGETYSECLQRLDLPEGLIAEAQYRRLQFESMLEWPTGNDRIRLWRYEDIIGNEASVFSELLRHHQYSSLQRLKAQGFARAFSASGLAPRRTHMRNPASGQWREHFTPKVEAWVEAEYGAVLESTGYR